MKRCLVAMFLFCLPLNVYSQVAITGKITGRVIDQTGATVPGAIVTASGSALMAPRMTITQVDGTYLFDLLPPGTYEVTVALTSFKTYVHKDVVIQAGFTATVNAALEMGALEETVTVSSESIIDVQNMATLTTYDSALLQNIPSGRDNWSQVAQTPGATATTIDVAGNQSYQQSNMVVHGSIAGQHAYSYNGLRLNWPGGGGGATAFYNDHDSLEEFQLVTDTASAEVGVGGVYMNMVTKSGSNQVHGLVAAYYLTAGLEAETHLPIFNGKPVLAGNPFVMSRDTTANAGAPIIKNRWWVFGAYRRYDIRQDILAVQRQSGGPVADINHQSDTSLRSDWQVNSKNRASFVWLWNEQNRFFRRDTAFSFVSDQAAWRQIEPAYILQGLWTSQFTNNLLLDVRFGYMHLIYPMYYQPTVGPNHITVQDLVLSTESFAAPYNYVNPAQTERFAATASYFKGAFLGGSHNLKFGYEVGRGQSGNQYTINHDITEQLRSGVPYSVTIYNTPITESGIIHDTAVFVQDSWNLKRRLTLNLGLRYEHFRTFYPAQSSPATGTYVSIFPNRTFPESPDLVSWNSVAPRIGIAFDPKASGKQVIRASYGRYYLIQGTSLLETVNPNFLSSQTYLWNGATTNGIPTGFMGPGISPVSSTGGVFTRIDPNLKAPHTDEVSATYERQVIHDLRVGVGYYFRNLRNQYAVLNTLNPRSAYSPVSSVNPLTGQAMTTYILDPALKGQTANLLTTIPDLDNNRYDGLEFTASKRFSHRWQILTGFTIQRQKGTFRSGNADDFNDPNRDINRADNYLNLDSTYVFKIDGTYNWWYGFVSSVNFQHYTGQPLRPVGIFSNLNKGAEQIALLPAGVVRLPSVNLLNLRISRPISIREQFKIEPIVDLFNLTNSGAVTSMVATFGANYLRPSAQLNPFVARIGLRINF